jgi:hypothetical protein
MAEMPNMSSRGVSEQWLAFDLLMAWAEAIVRLRPRLETALSRLTRPSRATSTDELRVEVHERRFASHTFNTERHLFIDAAWQLIEYREWVGRLGIVSNDAFRELDPFEKAVKTLKGSLRAAPICGSLARPWNNSLAQGLVSRRIALRHWRTTDAALACFNLYRSAPRI